VLTAVPPNAQAVRAMFRQIGLRQALDGDRVPQEVLDWFLAMLRDTDTMRNELRAGPRLIFLRGMDDHVLFPESLLATIRSPVSLLWGEEDPFGGADIARSIRRFVGC
jgi:pimeloyl-ACP methyl ester carboxylesterase